MALHTFIVCLLLLTFADALQRFSVTLSLDICTLSEEDDLSKLKNCPAHFLAAHFWMELVLSFFWNCVIFLIRWSSFWPLLGCGCTQGMQKAFPLFSFIFFQCKWWLQFWLCLNGGSCTKFVWSELWIDLDSELWTDCQTSPHAHVI